MPNREKETRSYYYDGSYLLLDRKRGPEIDLVALVKDELTKLFVIPYLGSCNYAIKVFLDGVSAAGKGKILEYLAELGFDTTSTGTIARGLTKFAIDAGYTSWNSPAEKEERISLLRNRLQRLRINLEKVGEQLWLVINETDNTTEYTEIQRYNVKTDLGSPEVTKNISYIAGLDFVCDMLDETLVILASQFKHVAFDGRDNIARRILTEEELAYVLAEYPSVAIHTFYAYIYADEWIRQERAMERRLGELAAKNTVLSEEDLAAELDEIRTGVAQRDARDISRARGSLMHPEKARESKKYDLFLDTTDLSIEEMQVYFLAQLFAHIGPQSGVVLCTMLTNYFKNRETIRQDALQLADYLNSPVLASDD